MTKHLGQELYIQVEDPENVGTYVDFCGITSTDFSMGPEMVDRVVPECDGDRTKPASVTKRAGNIDLSFSGSGIAELNTRTKAIFDAARTGVTLKFKVIVPAYGSFTGPAYVKITFTGNTNEDLAISAEFGWESVPAFAVAA
ncbi:phage tail tube protein [Cohaesibacter haloalkalitolerans]|uniref:phage tail tube protein n=1 Tax=Cohaesibacter haloalkalitolerans TaxID=1162980 RepID=UPI000E6597D2|nr:phage tail tube protein [Cohaesibacter haloalkalitolerans]